MPGPQDKPRYPLLTNLLLMQLVALASGICLLYFAYYWISQSYFENAQQSLREEARARLAAHQEELRTWHHLGLHTAVARGIEELRKTLPLKRLEVLPAKDIPPAPGPFGIVIPDSEDPLLDLKLYGELDPTLIYENYSLNRAAFYGFGLLTILFLGVLLFSLRYIFKHVYRPLLSVDRRFRSSADTGCFDVNGIEAAGEIRVFINRIKEMHEKASQAERQAALVEVSRQVAHDIRSPLAALSVLDSSLTELPEEKRLLLRSAISRVNDIANTLLIRSRGGGAELGSQSVLLDPMANGGVVCEVDQTVLMPSLVEALLTEKRLQYNQRKGLSIQLTPTVGMHGLFCRVQPNELKRVLSNLVNNAAEAIDGPGQISLFVSGGNDHVSIVIKDTGRGIPPAIVEELARAPLSFGKPTGTGLGIPHARKTISSWGGKLLIRSQVGVGTEVEIRLPRAVPPAWHVPVLEIPAQSRVVVLDDDVTIHQVWRERLKSIGSGSLGRVVESHHFFSAADFSLWHSAHASLPGTSLYLVDYELRGESLTGLSVITSFKLGKSAILVSSHAEETYLQEACASQGIRLLPKNMAGHIPIVLRDASGRLDVTSGSQLHA